MLTYGEIIALRDKLESGEMDLTSAQTEYWKDFKEGQKSWHTKDWQERRATIIKDHCEICASKITLTLQHLSHPKPYPEYLKHLTRSYTNEHIHENPVVDEKELSQYVQDKYDYIPIPFCPNCTWSNLSVRVRKQPKYRCLGCKHEFDQPVYKSVDELISVFYQDEDALIVRDKCFISKDKWKNKHNLSSARYWLQREKVKNKDADAIGKQSFLLYLDDTIKYLSFENTITACKKCAYNFDMKGLELCPVCKTNYKGIQYPTCIQCLPEDRRKAALASIEFGKGGQAMHEDLGID